MAIRGEHVVLIAYAILLGVGGIMGFVRARSRASLISGLLSALGALAAAGLSLLGYRFGMALGTLLALCLTVLFGYRYAIRSKKFMPSGLLAVVSLAVVLVLMAFSSWA